MQKLRRLATVVVGALGVVGVFASSAFAQASGVGTSIQSAATEATSVISSNMPVVFGVAIAFVAWKVGKRVLGKI